MKSGEIERNTAGAAVSAEDVGGRSRVLGWGQNNWVFDFEYQGLG